jgi:hypothetical protein
METAMPKPVRKKARRQLPVGGPFVFGSIGSGFLSGGPFETAGKKGGEWEFATFSFPG